MENSQVQKDLKPKFFVVLIMLGVFFVSDAFCHKGDSEHTHPVAPDESGLSICPGPDEVTKVDGHFTWETMLHYPGCVFHTRVLPPGEPNREEQTSDPEQRQQQTPQQQTPSPDPEQRQQQIPGTDPTLGPLSLAPISTDPTNVGSGDSDDANPVSTPAYKPKEQMVSETYAKPMLPVKVTEYMLRDWIKNAGGGFPQWIEVYNPNAEPVNLKGYQFTYAHRRFANHPWAYKTQSIPNFMIPAQGAVIIANKPVRPNTWRDVIAGISNKQVWVIPNDNRFIQLKNGWHLTDPNGKVVHRIGHAFREYPSTDPSDWDSTLGRPHLPRHTEDGYRVSYQWPASVAPAEAHFYGNATDVGSPGFYEPAVPKAPSLVIRKKLGTWAELKSK